jgi:hypothetical protein
VFIVGIITKYQQNQIFVKVLKMCVNNLIVAVTDLEDNILEIVYEQGKPVHALLMNREEYESDKNGI